MRWVRHLLPNRIAGQMTVLLIAALVMAHAVTLTLLFVMRPLIFPDDPLHASAARAGSIVRLIDQVPPDDWAGVVAAVSDREHKVSIEANVPDPPAGDLSTAPERYRQLLGAAIGDPGRVFIAALPEAHEPGPRELLIGRIGVRLRDGRALIFERDRPFRHGPFLDPILLISLAMMAVTLILLSLWAARSLISPLSRFAEAVEHFGAQLEDRSLPDRGPAEVRQVARAFNRMRERISRLLENQTRMLTSVSHDLRTPLTRLRLRTEAIEDASLRQRMLQDLQVMDAMVTSALSFLRDQNAPEITEQVDLPALLQTICDQFADLGQSVVYEGPLHLSLPCRPDALQQAITNLIDNAVKFADTVTVRLRPHQSAGVLIEIEDDGPGVPDAEKVLVFGPFYRSDPSRRIDAVPGFGFGLSIARRIVEGHGGTIVLGDRAPQGLIVRVTLPAVAAPTAEANYTGSATDRRSA